MTTLRIILSRVLAAFSRRASDVNLTDEIQAHLDSLTEEHLRLGMSLDDARAAARHEFGGVERTKEMYRERRGLPFVDALAQDLRYAFTNYMFTPLRRIPQAVTPMDMTRPALYHHHSSFFNFSRSIGNRRWYPSASP